MFETPIFLLAALIGGVIPLILHLMRKRRAVSVPFPTLRFLKAAQQASSRSIRIEHLLLWLLRTLIMVLMGMAFAMPVLRASRGNFLGRAARDVALVLDLSFSMGYQAGRNTVFDEMLEMAADVIGGLDARDRFCIWLAEDQPRALIAEPIHDREAGLAQVRALSPGYGTSRLLPAMAAARDALRQSGGNRQLELHVMTDNQALAWKRPLPAGESDPGGAVWEPMRRLTTFVTLAGVPAPENTAPKRIELMPPILFQNGGGARLTVPLTACGPPRETTVTFSINGESQAVRPVSTGSAMAREAVLAVPPLPAGTHVGRVEVPRDNLPADDAFHFLIRVRDRMPTLVVGEETDTFFLRAALRAAAGGEAAFTWVRPAELGGQKLDGYAAVFLCNALPQPGQTITGVEQFVQRGGLLVVFPGSRAGPNDYQAWQCLPGPAVRLEEVPRAQVRQTMLWKIPSHPALESLPDALTDPVLAVQRLLVWDPPDTTSTEVVALSGGHSMLRERPFGDGRAMMFAVSADRAGSSFPLTPFFLPMVAQLVEYGAGRGGLPPFIWGTPQRPLDRIVADAGPEVRLSGPSGGAMPVRRVLQDGRTLFFVENLMEPGIYMRTGADGPQPVLAVNLPREESDLTPLDGAAVKALLGDRDVFLAEDRESLAARIQEHRVGRTYGELLLWIVLALVGVEFTYANRLARARGLLSESLHIESSGRVRGHGSADETPSGGEKG